MDKTLVSLLGGLAGMFGWGTSDFFANISSEKVGHTKTFFWSQLAGVALIITLVAFYRPSFGFSPTLLGLTVLSGITYALGYLLFYKGFEVGNVSVVSAVINLYVVFVILISFFLREQRLTPFQIPAIGLLLVGATLVSVNFNELRKGSISLLLGVKETLFASAMLGVLYWPLNEYIAENSSWLVVALLTKSVAVIVVYLFNFLKGRSLTIHKLSTKFWLVIATVGILEAVGVLGTTLGGAYGDNILVAPITSSLTVVTVTLAIIFLKEKIGKIQALGISMVVIGVILTAF